MVENVLAHFGILGMKWGVRRSQEQLDRLANRRSDIKKNQGVASKEYIKASKDLYIKKQESRLHDAKLSGNKAEQILARDELKFAKSLDKPGGSFGYFWSALQPVFGNITKDEKILLQEMERKSAIGRARTEKILKTVGAVAVPVITATAIAEGKYYIENKKFGIPSITFQNGAPTIIVR